MDVEVVAAELAFPVSTSVVQPAGPSAVPSGARASSSSTASTSATANGADDSPSGTPPSCSDLDAHEGEVYIGGMVDRMTEARLGEIAAGWGSVYGPIEGAADVADLLAEVRRAREVEVSAYGRGMAEGFAQMRGQFARDLSDARREALEEAVAVAKREEVECDRLAEIERTWTRRNPGYTARDVDDHAASESDWRIRSCGAARIADRIHALIRALEDAPDARLDDLCRGER